MCSVRNSKCFIRCCCNISKRSNGLKLFVPVTNEHLKESSTVKVKDVITVKYSGVNVHNKLIQPYFFRKRDDFVWKDFVNQGVQQIVQ